MLNPRRGPLAFLAVVVAFVLLALRIVADARGGLATMWMSIFAVQDFRDFGDLIEFLSRLRVPIPPLLSAVEILSFQTFGSTDLVTVHLYRFSLVASYALAIALAYPSVPRAVVSAVASLVLLRGTMIVHPGNPQVYDVLYPFLLVLFVALLRVAGRDGESARGSGPLLGFGMGLVLSLLELTRPFVVLLVPFLAGAALRAIRPLSVSRILSFLLPVVLISGLWHVHQAVSFGQIVWSNHGGFNLIRSWNDAPMPPLVAERGSEPLAPGRRENLNNPDHLTNSRILQRAVMGHLASQPYRSCVRAVRKVMQFAKAPTRIAFFDSRHPFLEIYRPVASLLFLALFAIAFRLLLVVVTSGRSGFRVATEPGAVLVFFALASVLILALSERDEEGRMVISIAPMLAALPMAIPSRRAEPSFEARVVAWTMFAIGLPLVALAPLLALQGWRLLDFGPLAVLTLGLLCAMLGARERPGGGTAGAAPG